MAHELKYYTKLLLLIDWAACSKIWASHLNAEPGCFLVPLQPLEPPHDGHILFARLPPLTLGLRQLALQLERVPCRRVLTRFHP